MKKYKLYRYILSQSVSLMLMIVVFTALIIYIVTDRNMSAFLGMALLNMSYHVINNAKERKQRADKEII